MTSPDTHTLTGAYALDALTELERRQFKSHLRQCPDCASEVLELRATAARMALAAAEHPPEALRRRVMAQVVTTRQEAPPGSVTPGRSRTDRHRPGWTLRLTASAACVAAAAAVGLAVVTVRAEQQRDAAQTEVAQLEARYGPLTQLAAAPDTRISGGTGPGGATVIALASHSLDRAVLLAGNMPAPPAGHAYQAWLINAGHPRSIGLIPTGPTSATAPLRFAQLHDADKVGITIEPAGGSTHPTTSPIVLFALSS